jgi:hypothetical protein
MRSTCSGILGVLFAICLALPANAQDANAQDSVVQSAPDSATPTLTGKERLGGKWKDEQRIDNCNVPISKRGSRPRPSVCPHGPASDDVRQPLTSTSG